MHEEPLGKQHLVAHFVPLRCRSLRRLRHHKSMTKPQLPECSAPNCRRLAGAIIAGKLLCGEHAIATLKTLHAASPPKNGEERC